MQPFRPNIIDIEASGFGVDSYPIEVGIVLSTGQKYCALIKPAHDWLYWDKQAELVHGLSLDLLWSHGKSIDTVDLALKRHRASADALVIQETYVRTQQMLPQEIYLPLS
jgi:hypothetical protein